MKLETAVRILWPVAGLCFVGGLLANLWGVQLQLSFMSGHQRELADISVLRGHWIVRSLVLLTIACVTGIAGLVCAWRAARVHGPFKTPTEDEGVTVVSLFKRR